MLTIRLTRVGRKNDPSFRVIIIDSKRKVKAGNYLEMLGSHDPRTNRTELKAERIKYWMSHGAQTSDTVHNLLVSQKIIDAKKINVLPAFKKPEEKSVEVQTLEEVGTPTENVGAENKEETVSNEVVEEKATE
jgi:small subunit ribosomal protein S16